MRSFIKILAHQNLFKF